MKLPDGLLLTLPYEQALPGDDRMPTLIRIHTLTNEQQTNIKQMASSLTTDTMADKRGTAEIWAGNISMLDDAAFRLEIKVANSGPIRPGLLLISEQPLPASMGVCLATRDNRGEVFNYIGKTEASRPGLRAEDKDKIIPEYFTTFEITDVIM